MPRCPVISASEDPVTSSLIERIRSQRGGELPLLYQVLLNSPAIAAGWLGLLTAIRQNTSLPHALREMIILRIAVLNDARYEFDSHVPYARRAGIAEEWIDALRVGQVPAGISRREEAALRYADEMTRHVAVRAETHDTIAEAFDAEAMVELAVTVGAYNMVSRVLVALAIEQETT